MEKLEKDKTIKTFIKNILSNEKDNDINEGKDLLIKSLRLLNDDSFWDFYNEQEKYRNKSIDEKEKFKQEQFTDGVKYGLEYPCLKNDIKQIEDMIELLKSKEQSERTQEVALGLLQRFKTYAEELVVKNRFYNLFLRDDYDVPLMPIVKDFCYYNRHDCNTIGGLVHKIVFENIVPEGLNDCYAPYSFEEEDIKKYKCRWIQLHGKNHKAFIAKPLSEKHIWIKNAEGEDCLRSELKMGDFSSVKDSDLSLFNERQVAFMKIYKNTRKENIKAFLKETFNRIELSFGEGKLYKKHKMGKLFDNVVDKYEEIENNIDKSFFKRDLSSYYEYLQGKTLEQISQSSEYYNFDPNHVSKVIGRLNMLIKSNYNKDIQD